MSDRDTCSLSDLMAEEGLAVNYVNEELEAQGNGWSIKQEPQIYGIVIDLNMVTAVLLADGCFQ